MLSLTVKRFAERTFVRYPFWITGETFELPSPEPGIASVLVVKPKDIKANETRPIIFWMHKGGFVVGSFRDRDMVPRLVQAGMVVVSIDYPLSPEHVFPETSEVVLRTILYYLKLHTTRAQTLFQADLSKVAVAGYSAGGNLAASLAKLLPKEGIKLKSHFIVAGALRFHDFQDSSVYRAYPSLKENAHFATLPIDDLIWFWNAYCPVREICIQDVRAQAEMGLASDISPAIVYVGASDILRDENRKYAEKLKEAGSSSTFILGAGTHWGSVLFDSVGVTEATEVFRKCMFQEASCSFE
jgi:acetyl esterase